jgi:hypothetical protein
MVQRFNYVLRVHTVSIFWNIYGERVCDDHLSRTNNFKLLVHTFFIPSFYQKRAVHTSKRFPKVTVILGVLIYIDKVCRVQCCTSRLLQDETYTCTVQALVHKQHRDRTNLTIPRSQCSLGTDGISCWDKGRVGLLVTHRHDTFQSTVVQVAGCSSHYREAFRSLEQYCRGWCFIKLLGILCVCRRRCD